MVSGMNINHVSELAFTIALRSGRPAWTAISAGYLHEPTVTKLAEIRARSSPSHA